MTAEAERFHISQSKPDYWRACASRFPIKLNGTSLPVIGDGRLISRAFADSTQNAILIQNGDTRIDSDIRIAFDCQARRPFLRAAAFRFDRSTRVDSTSFPRGFLCECRSCFPRVRVDVRQLFIAVLSSAPQFAKRSGDSILSGTL